MSQIKRNISPYDKSDKYDKYVPDYLSFTFRPGIWNLLFQENVIELGKSFNIYPLEVFYKNDKNAAAFHKEHGVYPIPLLHTDHYISNYIDKLTPLLRIPFSLLFKFYIACMKKKEIYLGSIVFQCMLIKDKYQMDKHLLHIFLLLKKDKIDYLYPEHLVSLYLYFQNKAKGAGNGNKLNTIPLQIFLRSCSYYSLLCTFSITMTAIDLQHADKIFEMIYEKELVSNKRDTHCKYELSKKNPDSDDNTFMLSVLLPHQVFQIHHLYYALRDDKHYSMRMRVAVIHSYINENKWKDVRELCDMFVHKTLSTDGKTAFPFYQEELQNYIDRCKIEDNQDYINYFELLLQFCSICLEVAFEQLGTSNVENTTTVAINNENLIRQFDRMKRSLDIIK